jgi:hypothetical protein
MDEGLSAGRGVEPGAEVKSPGEVEEAIKLPAMELIVFNGLALCVD